MQRIAPFGRILIIGFTSGRAALAKTNHLLIKDAEAIGLTIGALSRLDPAWEKRNFAVLMGWLAAGRIKPYISHRLPLSQAGEALKLVMARQVVGKAVLINGVSLLKTELSNRQTHHVLVINVQAPPG